VDNLFELDQAQDFGEVGSLFTGQSVVSEQIESDSSLKTIATAPTLQPSTAESTELSSDLDASSLRSLASLTAGSQSSQSGNGSAPELILDPINQLVTVNDASPTVSVLWDRAVQLAVINARPGPTVASRAYGMVHTAIFDAWAAYDPTAIATQLGDDLQRSSSENTIANKTEAMSYAAYRVLTELFPNQAAIFDALMTQLGFDPSNTTTDTTRAAGIGNISAEALLAFRRNDGSNQLGTDPNGTLGRPYSDNSGYTSVNGPRATIDIEQWTPEPVPIDAAPGEEIRVQSFLTPQWGNVTPFGLESGSQFRPAAPQPFLLDGIDGEVDLAAKTITLSDGTVLPISKDLIGTVINPGFIEQAQRVIDTSANLTDEQKLIAEFWEDGGGTSFPPGTWMTFGQFVSARENHSLDTDAQLFFGLGNAVFDAGVATWEAKTAYNYTRPVRAIRELGRLGLVGEFDANLGGFAIDAWGGPGQGTQRILATDFITYQTPGADPSPPFAEYTSGHSAFSAAGSQILKLFTGSDTFGGSVSFQPGQSRFEPGITPQNGTTLAWETFTAAADEAGISRIYGGIHFNEGDLNGRSLGRQVGSTVLDKALFFINGGQAVHSITGTERRDVLRGTQGDDRIVALGGNDIVQAGNGNDQALGGDGKDFILGGSGNDDLSGGNGRDDLQGNSGNDILWGGADRDNLLGGIGNDLLFGGTEGDTLSGGQGRDGFVFSHGDGKDTILDFSVRTDFIGLLGGLTFSDLTISQRGRSTVLGVTSTGESLATLENVRSNQLTANQFVAATDLSELINSNVVV
jgi:Ca2+-binding RTX toxin-like protein